MSTTLLFAVGCVVFTITTLAALWAGYLLFQRAWVYQNPKLMSDAAQVGPVFAKDYPQVHDPGVADSQ